MKQFLQILIFLCFATVAYAQNTTEAKMAYQIAEEKFDAKQYAEALEYLEKAETALGGTNPPMLFLKVMITNQIVTVKESADNYQKLEKAIADFDKHKDINALGEDKLMDVYRIKVDLDKRKNAYENKIEFDKMIYRLASEFPKTELPIAKVLENIPQSWAKLLSKEEIKQRNKTKKGVVEVNYFRYSDIKIDQFFLQNLSFDSKTEPYIVYQYAVGKLLNKEVENNSERQLAVDEICNILKINKQLWNGFILGVEPLITKTEQGDYFITSKIDKNQINKDYKIFQMKIHKKTIPMIGGMESMQIVIFKNTY